MAGSWNIDVKVNTMPEKVATAFAELNNLVGAEYTPIAYLGSQIVNGTNHAVLAEQLVLSGKDTKNIVLIIFNEKGMECTLVNIERVVSSGNGAGAITVDSNTDIPDEIMSVWEDATEDYVGVNLNVIALLGSQVVHGINYLFAAEVTPVTANPVKKVCVVTVNSESGIVSFVDILKGGSVHMLGSTMVGLQSPWVTYAEEIMQLFKGDPEVHCEYDDGYELKIFVDSEDKATALTKLIPTDKIIGNVTFNVTVVPADGVDIDEDCDLEFEDLFEDAFDGNPAVSYITTRELFLEPVTYVVFANEVVQFFNDDLSDINGLKSTLYEDIARNVFNVDATVCFCTDTPKKF